ncbi:hypothetical protein CF319_g2142 [Tilletia indica]|uniref:Pacifastin domain-containing protein n=1 Tax=Tilletia indica TaxID=43049 RepID=A0A8T8T3B0_9BASI|nr:hypothetical protein CF319_g2142 [Tilletia indica]KAE8254515.1 hypothetical protein A4X13_0g3397 [Tilletia indica]
MKLSLVSIFLVAGICPFMVNAAMNCPVGSPGTDYCKDCGCYCGSDKRVHCDENTTCYSTSGSAQARCMSYCTC